MKFQLDQFITFKPTPNSDYVTGPIERIFVDGKGRVQYHVRIQHGPRYSSCYWVWEQEARLGGVQLPLFLPN